MKIFKVSIPSSGSIQFLQKKSMKKENVDYSLNPLKRVNSILTDRAFYRKYKNIKNSLNPLKRVNSILTDKRVKVEDLSLDSESQSPQTGQFNSYLSSLPELTELRKTQVSQSPQTGQFNSYAKRIN